MKNESELTLIVLEYCLKYGPAISMKGLRAKTKIPQKTLKYILSVLEKRGYVLKGKYTGTYILNRNVINLI